MGSFGDAVSSLVDTYTKCLAFVKDFERGKQPTESGSGLREALRKARSRVRRVYSSKLSHEGSSFERGDAASTSSLKRVIRRLTATLSSLKDTSFSSPGSGRRALDYTSLVSLCDSSRADAIRTMTYLSSRISGRSHPKNSSPRTGKKSRRSARTPPRRWDARVKPGRENIRGNYLQASDEDGEKRVSRITTLSNSTKLGEIRSQGASHGPGSKAAYPRRLQKHDLPSKSKRRWGIF